MAVFVYFNIAKAPFTLPTTACLPTYLRMAWVISTKDLVIELSPIDMLSC